MKFKLEEIPFANVGNKILLLNMLYKVVLTIYFMDEIIECDHSNESYWAVLSRGAVYYALQGGSNFESVDEIL